MEKLELRCPCCRKCNERVILQLHWTKKYHMFICGNCKAEFEVMIKEGIPMDAQIQESWMAYLKFECSDKIDDIEARVKAMTYEEKIRRLEELDKKKKGNE